MNDFVRQDPHNTTIDMSVVAALSASEFSAALPARVDVLAIDDDTPGVVVVESGSRTLVVAAATRV